MTSLIPSFGQSSQTSDLVLILQDLLSGMGSFFTQEVGSLVWIEAYINARALSEDKQFITLMANQLSPSSSSIKLIDWATIYNTLGLADPNSIKSYIELKQSQFNQPPTLSNLTNYLSNLLGNCFLDIEWAPELQQYATTDPTIQIEQDGYSYSSPLSKVFIYVWQPRDNQDNLLMPTPIFNNLVNSYLAIVEAWAPAYTTFITMNLVNRGNQDGYGGGYNGLNYNNYIDGFNVVSGTAGQNFITGTNTNFLADFYPAFLEGFNMPVQIVDDTNTVQTYYVETVNTLNPTVLTLTTPLINNITNRTYRTLGFVLDTPGMLDQGLFSF